MQRYVDRGEVPGVVTLIARRGHVVHLESIGASGQFGSVGTYGWNGATCTTTFVDPAEEIIGIMMTQVRPCTALNIRRDFQTLAYQAIVGSARTARAPN
jgi:hypothetical protein